MNTEHWCQGVGSSSTLCLRAGGSFGVGDQAEVTSVWRCRLEKAWCVPSRLLGDSGASSGDEQTRSENLKEFGEGEESTMLMGMKTPLEIELKAFLVSPWKRIGLHCTHGLSH